jgi:hypothetical protein
MDIGMDESESARVENIHEDWRMTLRECIMEHGRTRDRKVRRQALKYIVIDSELYRIMVDGLLLRCLDEEQAKIAMREVHEGMCSTHQSTHKI